MKARVISSNLLLLLLLVSCAKESVKIRNVNKPSPINLVYELSIPLDVNEFSPEKMVCDIKGNIFILGNRRRVIILKDKKIEEMNIEKIYPCEIIDIGTDGFDIFLLDRMNRKIWTVKREKVLEKGFTLDARPLFFSVSEKELFTVIYSNRREFPCFSRTEKRYSSFLLEDVVKEEDGGALLFQKNNIYFANKKKDRVEIFYLYNPAKGVVVKVRSPNSLALDAWENLFVSTLEGIVCITKKLEKRMMLSKEIPEAQISINNGCIYILNPDKKKIDVYKIFYTTSDSNVPQGE